MVSSTLVSLRATISMLFTSSNISISSLCLSKEGALSEQIKRPFFLSDSFGDEKPDRIDLVYDLNFPADRGVTPSNPPPPYK